MRRLEFFHLCNRRLWATRRSHVFRTAGEVLQARPQNLMPAARNCVACANGFDVVRSLLGCLLLIAVALNGYRLVAEPMAETSLHASRWFLTSRSFLTGTVEFEFAFGIWLIAVALKGCRFVTEPMAETCLLTSCWFLAGTFLHLAAGRVVFRFEVALGKGMFRHIVLCLGVAHCFGKKPVNALKRSKSDKDTFLWNC